MKIPIIIDKTTKDALDHFMRKNDFESYDHCLYFFIFRMILEEGNENMQ